MATDFTLLVKRPTARRKDPACGTCRKQCRKCDRKRPICGRCRTKGMHCEGYPPRFQFYNMITAPRRQSSEDMSQNIVAVSSTLSFPLSTISEEWSLESSAGPEAVSATSTTGSSSPQTALSLKQGLPDSTILSRSLAPSPTQSPFSPICADSALPLVGTSDLHTSRLTLRPIIDYFDRVLSEHLIIRIQGTENPFRTYLLPLAYQHRGVLHALLGLSACHKYMSDESESQRSVTISLQHRVSALHSLGSLLLKEEVSGLCISEEECVLGMVLLLVLHDVSETGVSSHGAHLTGVAFLCKRLACPTTFSVCSEASKFFISVLAWLDTLRGFSGAEKLAYCDDVRKCVRDYGSLSVHALSGCPPDIFYRIGQVLEFGKSFLVGDLSLEQFQVQLEEAERFFRSWDPHRAVYPTEHQEWRQLAEAYRHACLLRVLRFPDAFAISCDDARIKASVSAIFDISAAMTGDTVFHKRLLFPLFLAGADTTSPHQIHYESWRIGEIKHTTGFRHPAMTDLLTQVWEERRNNRRGWSNVPWMEFTCSELLRSQHAYLFF